MIEATKIAAPSDSVAFKALRKVAERLVAESAPGEELLVKRAQDPGVLLNPEHPLVQAFAGLVKAAEEKTRSGLALVEVEAGLKKTMEFLRSA